MKNLGAPGPLADLLGRCRRHDWVVYAKRPFGGPDHVLKYLGNYVHRIAISSHRLVGLADGKVSFRWRDSAHKNKKRVMTLAVEEFLRRFFLHVLPPGFVRIRYFGFLANRQRKRMLPLCRRLLAEAIRDVSKSASGSTAPGAAFWTCPVCGGVMVIVERLTAAEACIRPPPAVQEDSWC